MQNCCQLFTNFLKPLSNFILHMHRLMIVLSSSQCIIAVDKKYYNLDYYVNTMEDVHYLALLYCFP